MSNQHVPRRYLHEAERRRRSFVIIGLPELEERDRIRRGTEDYKAACDIVRYLGVDDEVHAHRVGNGPEGSRNLMVTLPTSEARNLVLQRKHFLYSIDKVATLRLHAAHIYPPPPF